MSASQRRAPSTDCDAALIPETATDEPRLASASGETDAPDPVSRSPARYLWATLIARLFEIFPLTCRYCGAEMKIIAFIIEAPSVRAILEHIGEPTRPPLVCAARPCATPQRFAILLRVGTGPDLPWSGCSLLCRSSPCSAWVPAQTVHGSDVRCSITAHPPAWDDAPVEVDPHYDFLAQPEPEMEFDQRIQW